MKRSWVSIITNNLGYKILSLLIAIVIWYAVVDANDPVDTSSFTIHVEVVNGSYIENGKQIYRIAEEYKSVMVYVKANRSVLSTITDADIHVTADLTQIVDLDREPVMVPLQVTVDESDVKEVTLSRQTIPIEIENIASKEFPITVSTGDSSVDKDYEIGALTPSIESVVLKGSESIISNIESVVARINVEGMAASGSVPGTITVMDKSQTELSESVLRDDITWDEEVDDITVYVELWKKRSGVTLKALYSGTPEPGYQVSNIVTTPEEITVAGNEAALKSLEKAGNTITIPGDEISVEGASEDKVFEIDIKEYLPYELKLSSSMAESVVVYVSILPVNSREFQVDVDEINVQGLADNLTVSYDNPEITVILMSVDNKLAALTPADIKLSVDASGKKAGDYPELPLTAELPSGVTLVNNPVITIHLKEKPSTSDDSGGAESTPAAAIASPSPATEATAASAAADNTNSGNATANP